MYISKSGLPDETKNEWKTDYYSDLEILIEAGSTDSVYNSTIGNFK